jgi:hypothetical protein
MKYAELGRSVLVGALVFSVVGNFTACQSAEGSGSGSKKATAATAAPKAATTQSTPSTPAAAATQSAQRKLVVYYLHGTYRCPSCNKIESLTKEAVQEGFAQAIAKGRVELRVLNVEEPGNEHFVQDYKLYTKSVVLSDLKDGKELKWKNLEQVWTLLGNETKFIDYIQKEMKSYLEG